MKTLIIAEKPSQGRDIAGAIETRTMRKDGYIEGDKYIITWAVGHLLQLKDPGEIDEKYQKWNLANLPIKIDEENIIGNYKPNERTTSQLKAIEQLLKRDDIDSLINATDPDREGELIFQNIYAYFKVNKPFKRLIIKDLTPDGIKEQFTNLELGEKYEGLKMSAYGRAISDYIIGLNMTRAYSCKYRGGGVLSVGRVQTPTLKLIYDRCKENAGHQKKIEYGIKAKIHGTDIELELDKFRVVKKGEAEKKLLELPDKVKITSTKEDKKKAPPKLPTIIDIQKLANNFWSYKADSTLSIVQSLYEKHKAVSYPRTDCNFITQNTADKLNSRIGNFSKFKGYEHLTTKVINEQVVGEVEAHEAITPTGIMPQSLSEEEKNIFNLVVAIFLANYCDDYQYRNIKYEGIVDTKNVLKGTEKELIDLGYLKVYKDTSHTYKEILADGEYDIEYEIKEIESKPKPLFTQATLLEKMKNIHNEEEGEIKEKLKEIKGIGTGATRGAIIETLYKREYIADQKKAIVITDKGKQIIDILLSENSKLLDVGYTADLEYRLDGIIKDKAIFNSFLYDINVMCSDMLSTLKGNRNEVRFVGVEKNRSEFICPVCSKPVLIGEMKYYCSGYRDGCKYAILKRVGLKNLTANQLKTLITKGKTAFIKGFINHEGKKFDGYLVYNKELMRLEFSFK